MSQMLPIATKENLMQVGRTHRAAASSKTSGTHASCVADGVVTGSPWEAYELIAQLHWHSWHGYVHRSWCSCQRGRHSVAAPFATKQQAAGSWGCLKQEGRQMEDCATRSASVRCVAAQLSTRVDEWIALARAGSLEHVCYPCLPVKNRQDSAASHTG